MLILGISAAILLIIRTKNLRDASLSEQAALTNSVELSIFVMIRVMTTCTTSIDELQALTQKGSCF